MSAPPSSPKLKPKSLRQKLAALRKHIDLGLQDIERGRVIDADLDDIFKRAIARPTRGNKHKYVIASAAKQSRSR